MISGVGEAPTNGAIADPLKLLVQDVIQNVTTLSGIAVAKAIK